jgi:hypothetical protein
MIYLFLLLFYGFIIWLEVPQLVEKNDHRLLATFVVLIALAMGMSLTLVLSGEIPSPTMALMKLLAPLATKVFGLKI